MESVNEVMEPDDANDDSDEEKRDYLGEMLISAIMMITGGEDAELKRMTRADRYLVTRAIIRAAVRVSNEGKPHPLTQDVALELAKGTKMWRKLNAWFWLATQNLKDFPGSMSRVLSMCEFWMLLTMDKNEIEEIARFRSLTPEQRHMMESAVKEPAKYTEGVLISANNQWLFRNVPPALPIALAMTEGHEKAERRRLMDEHGCTEVQAAYRVAARLQEARA